MTRKEATKELYRRPWKASTCSQGESCWCRIIKTVEPIEYQVTTKEEDEVRFDTLDEIVSMGCIDKDFAEYVVTLHNNFLEKKSEIFEAF
jgi:hypothetical protein